MFQKSLIAPKRLSAGYGFLFAVILVVFTFEWPFVLIVGKGLGILPFDVLPIPRGIFGLSVVITWVVGLRWLWFPSQWLDTKLMQLWASLLRSDKWLLLRFVGILIAIPLFAFILIPCAILWAGLEEAAYHFHVTGRLLQWEYPIAMILGFIWLAMALGRLCSPSGKLRRLFLRCQMIFIDWVLEPHDNQAARLEREKVHQRCKE